MNYDVVVHFQKYIIYYQYTNEMAKVNAQNWAIVNNSAKK